MQPTLSLTQIDTARIVVSSPHAYPLHQLQTAWATLKEARGQPVNFDRLRSAHHLVEHNPCATRISTKVRNRAAAKGYRTAPSPHFDGAA